MKDVLIVMGSESDYPTMKEAEQVLQDFGVSFETRITSAHRTPERMADSARTACEQGFKVIIAGAGGAAHLPGMMAAYSELPVIGVPIAHGVLEGQDALLSIVQMPRGVPVATVAIAGGANAGLLAVQILSADSSDRGAKLREKVREFKSSLERKGVSSAASFSKRNSPEST